MDDAPYAEVIGLAIALADANGHDWPYMSEGNESNLTPKDQRWWLRIAEKAFDHLQRRAEDTHGVPVGKLFGPVPVSAF